jgi:hypothetical protein
MIKIKMNMVTKDSLVKLLHRPYSLDQNAKMLKKITGEQYSIVMKLKALSPRGRDESESCHWEARRKTSKSMLAEETNASIAETTYDSKMASDVLHR